MIILRHESGTYELYFEAYLIGEELLRVADLRKKAALKIEYAKDPHHLRLFYKEKILHDDSKTCREEGLKQNSQVICIVSESESSDNIRDALIRALGNLKDQIGASRLAAE